jgi:signal peptidase II
LFLVIVGGGTAVDLATKALVFERFHDPQRPASQAWWIDGVLGIQTSFNNGALFGMLQGFQWLFVVLSLAAFFGIVFWLFFKKGAESLLMLITMSLICAGILGNLYDRLGFGYREIYEVHQRYAVRDWIHFRWEGISFLDPWPNFNIADSMLVCGAITLFLMAFLTKNPSDNEFTDQLESDTAP